LFLKVARNILWRVPVSLATLLNFSAPRTCTALALWAVAAAAAAPTAIQPDGITRLYGSGAALEQGLRFQKGPNWILVDSAGSLKWEISVGAAWEYEVSLCYSAKSAEAPVVVQAGES